MKISDLKGLMRGQTIADEAEELKNVALRYVKEETVDPVKALGRYTAFGCAGSFFVGLGGLLMLVGVLRMLAHGFHGTVSWIPYLIMSVLGVVVIGFTIKKIASGPSKRRIAKKKAVK